jgi:hypothetical protein
MDVPLNLDRVYVMATTKSGCEVYFPLKNTDNIDEKKEMCTKMMSEY